jgi:hypothetical protein
MAAVFLDRKAAHGDTLSAERCCDTVARRPGVAAPTPILPTEFVNLTFVGPCIANLFSSITNSMQRYTIYFFL